MNGVPVSIVVAMAENRVIGRDGGLPWRLSSDLRWFKQVTLGKPVVMGRATWDSIGRPLPGRDNIVLSRRPGFALAGATLATSLDDALALAQDAATEAGSSEVCVIGGGAVYERALARTDRLYLTVVEAEVAGDTVFPRLDPAEWSVRTEGRITPDERNDHPARIEVWERR